ncbi:hypothetical protein [Agromyces aerolatus]|uniref:hypothetical protein n=1 Tax=Agromyces sp. LY-1074 TaxID=3074080 RepID=UPI0028656C97|nr:MULTISPECIES: hypothetical protein [unclassified Agromyces]MDR5698412.1 hypothetical protein [Agromyces sp. LY-1074]MDR5704706.1 hypothetical protein [Agromyces sp. LY-1358]
MRPDDAVLAAHPEEFRFARSTAKTVVFTTLTVLALVGLVLAVVNFDAIRGDAATNMSGRRAGLSPVVAPVVVVAAALFTVLFGLLAWRESHAWRRLATGTALTARRFTVAGGDDVAEALHARFVTGDPAQYLPVPNHKKGDVAVRVYLAKPDRIAFITVQRGKGAETRAWPLITFRDRAYVQLKNLQPVDFGQPAKKAGAAGSIDPFLRG